MYPPSPRHPRVGVLGLRPGYPSYALLMPTTGLLLGALCLAAIAGSGVEKEYRPLLRGLGDTVLVAAGKSEGRRLTLTALRAELQRLEDKGDHDLNVNRVGSAIWMLEPGWVGISLKHKKLAKKDVLRAEQGLLTAFTNLKVTTWVGSIHAGAGGYFATVETRLTAWVTDTRGQHHVFRFQGSAAEEFRRHGHLWQAHKTTELSSIWRVDGRKFDVSKLRLGLATFGGRVPTPSTPPRGLGR